LNKKSNLLSVLFFAICLVAVALFVVQYVRPSYTTVIEVNEIPKVLGVVDMPKLPSAWKATKIEKYDDGFTTPHVIIQYENGVTMSLSLSEMAYPDLEKQFLQIGEQFVWLYETKDRLIYVFRHEGFFYHMICPKQQKDSVLTFITHMR
jgi:hypothetical protein